MVDGKWKTTWKCPYYVTWSHMLNRCYGVGRNSYHRSYNECCVFEGWHLFSEFQSWMSDQDWVDKSIDKDLLLPGNKVYSPDTCVFISNDLNKFLIDQPRNRRGLAGCTWVERRQKYQSQCWNPFSRKREFLGHFDTEVEAHVAWRKRKHKFACMYADMQIDPRIENALRSRYA